MPRSQPPDEIGGDVVVSPGCQTQADTGVVDISLEPRDRPHDCGAGIGVHSRENVRRARDHLDVLLGINSRHLKRERQVSGAVIDAGQYMAVQVDHRPKRSQVEQADAVKYGSMNLLNIMSRRCQPTW